LWQKPLDRLISGGQWPQKGLVEFHPEAATFQNSQKQPFKLAN
jgi:hypothetical protein